MYVYSLDLEPPPKMETVSTLFIKLVFREIKTFVQGHLARDWRN